MDFGRPLLVTCVALGWALGFAPWFWPSAAPLSVLLGLGTLGLLGRRKLSLLLPVGVGLFLAALPPLVGFGPTEHPPAPVGQAASASYSCGIAKVCVCLDHFEKY